MNERSKFAVLVIDRPDGVLPGSTSWEPPDAESCQSLAEAFAFAGGFNISELANDTGRWCVVICRPPA